MDEPVTIFTIGHSTHPIEVFIELLREQDISRLVDIRTIPRSRHNPQFEQTALRESLPAAGIEYVYLKELGGLRPKVKDSQNTAWRNASFRNYADYMQTEAFALALEELLRLAAEQTTAIMCAELLPWRCHRSLVGDALLVRGVRVVDILGPGQTREHQLTRFAQVSGTTILYPGGDQDAGDH